MSSGGVHPEFEALRFAAMLKAARDFGLDQTMVNAIALMSVPGRPDLPRVAEALAEALLARNPFRVPGTA